MTFTSLVSRVLVAVGGLLFVPIAFSQVGAGTDLDPQVIRPTRGGAMWRVAILGSRGPSTARKFVRTIQTQKITSRSIVTWGSLSGAGRIRLTPLGVLPIVPRRGVEIGWKRVKSAQSEWFWIMADGDRQWFIGTQVQAMDPKGRLVLPARFVRLLPEGQNTMVLTVGTDPCLLLYPMGEWSRMAEGLRALARSEATRNAVRFVSDHSTELELDAHGRLTVPRDFLV